MNYNEIISRLKKKICQASVRTYLDGNSENFDLSKTLSYAGNEWDDLVISVIREVNDAPMSFLRQPTISRTVHPNELGLAFNYLKELGDSDFARKRILPRLHDVPMGDPHLCPFFPFASPVSVQHAYYLMLINKYLNVFLPENNVQSITDVGGGYGNFCRILYSLGYDGRYKIIDLAGMHLLQQHYLKSACPNEIKNNKIDFGLLNDCKPPSNRDKSLFIATFSISEMPIATRKALEPEMSEFEYIFLAYNQSFGGVDNMQYFKELIVNLKKTHYVEVKKDKYRRAWFVLGEKK